MGYWLAPLGKARRHAGAAGDDRCGAIGEKGMRGGIGYDLVALLPMEFGHPEPSVQLIGCVGSICFCAPIGPNHTPLYTRCKA